MSSRYFYLVSIKLSFFFSIENSSTEDLIKPVSTDETSANDSQSSTEPDQLKTNIIEPSSTSPIDIKVNETVTNDNPPSPFTSPIKLEEINDNEKSTSENTSSTTGNSSEFFYDFRLENFHAEEVKNNLFYNLFIFFKGCSIRVYNM